jgi:Sensors of blue-light using FAD
MQLLEGEKKAVNRLFEKIKRDPQHDNVITLLSGKQEGRGFADFSMGFQNLDDPSLGSLPGYSTYLETPLSADAFSDPTNAQRLLRIFKRTTLSL